MSTTIPAVDSGNIIEHGVLIDLTLNNQTYYISNCYKPVTYNNHEYQALAGFLSVSEIQSNISNSNDDIQIALSAIPAVYIEKILGQDIKGGSVNVYRAFFNYNTQEILTGEVYKRFTGTIVNYSIQEDIPEGDATGTINHTITVICSSIMGVLENRYSGRRTNPEDFKVVYTELGNSGTDPSMDRVMTLYNAAFDFGRPYTAKVATQPSNNNNSNTGGYDGGGGGGSDGAGE